MFSIQARLRNTMNSGRFCDPAAALLNASCVIECIPTVVIEEASYESFSIGRRCARKCRGFRSLLFSVHPLLGCERLHGLLSASYPKKGSQAMRCVLSRTGSFHFEDSMYH